MNIPPVGATTPLAPPPEAMEPKGADVINDHDGDDAGRKGPLPPGVGTQVDKSV